MIKPPLRRLVEIGAGTSRLECGHIIDTRSGDKVSGRRQCVTCLSLEDRLRWLQHKKKRTTWANKS